MQTKNVGQSKFVYLTLSKKCYGWLVSVKIFKSGKLLSTGCVKWTVYVSYFKGKMHAVHGSWNTDDQRQRKSKLEEWCPHNAWLGSLWLHNVTRGMVVGQDCRSPEGPSKLLKAHSYTSYLTSHQRSMWACCSSNRVKLLLHPTLILPYFPFGWLEYPKSRL